MWSYVGSEHSSNQALRAGGRSRYAHSQGVSMSPKRDAHSLSWLPFWDIPVQLMCFPLARKCLEEVIFSSHVLQLDSLFYYKSNSPGASMEE